MNRKGLHQQRIFKTRIRMPVKHEMISGPSPETSYTAITANQESNSTRPKKESFPVPLKYMDVIRVTHTTLEILQGSRIDVQEICPIHGQVSDNFPC